MAAAATWAAAGTAAVIAKPPRRSKKSSSPEPHWRRRIALAGAVLYLAFVWLDAVGTHVPTTILPRPVSFFVQVAQLFPRAAVDAIEWRAKGFHCDRRKFGELDLSPYFPIHANDKEGRFDRALFFHLENKRVLEALDAYIADAEGKRGDRLGGVMLLSLRTPIAPPGSDEPRYERLPVDEIPPSVKRTYWYVTGADERERRCQ
ncbi:MAG TPA: hypothetical protein VGL86_27710 [Polyangia bacterium]